MVFHSRPVHSFTLSSHRFLCLPLHLPPCTVPCRIVLASPDDRVTCPYYFTLHLFTEVRFSYGPMAFPILALTSWLVMWSLYEILRSLRKYLISNTCILLSMSAVMAHVSHAYKNMDMARERISLILELMTMFLSFQMTFSLVTAANSSLPIENNKINMEWMHSFSFKLENNTVVTGLSLLRYVCLSHFSALCVR